MSQSIEKIIFELENKLLDPKVRSNEGELAKLLSNDFFEFGSSGKEYNKQSTISALKKEECFNLSISNFKAKELAEDVFLVTYKINAPKDGSRSGSLRSSIWTKNGDDWKLLFHQGTKSCF